MSKCLICERDVTSTIYVNSSAPLCRYGFTEAIDEDVDVVSINVLFCDKCQFGWNNLFKYESVNYKSNKIIESNRFSQRYKKHFETSSDRIKKYLDGKLNTIVEIGAGSCDFLSHFDNVRSRYAIEPSDEINLNLDKTIVEINDLFLNSNYIIPSDLIIFRQVLEHVSQPKSFLLDAIRCFHKSDEVSYFYIEVPNSDITFSDGRFYDIYYDHCNYFTVNSMLSLLDICGLKLCELTLEMNKEIICLIASTERHNTEVIKNNLDSQIVDLGIKINYYLSLKKKLFIWGAAGNGANLLNTLKLDSSLIPFVIDKDPQKHHKFIPITNQRIISPEEAVEAAPDVILIMSQFHRPEISRECLKIFGTTIILI